MKYGFLFVFASVLSTGAFAQSQSAPTTSSVHVLVDSEAKELAAGYATAFTQLSRPPLTITLQKEGVLRVLEDVKQVLEPDMTLIVHPNTYHPVAGYIVLGDVVRVTETGCKVLTKTSRELFSEPV